MGDTNNNEQKEKKLCCKVSLEDSIHARKCFMTGEYCSKQTNIQKERDELHKEKKINAFVIMNFSDMSDVVYRWKLRDFIASLKKYLYIDTDNKVLYCVDDEKREEYCDIVNEKDAVSEIHELRSDSEPASNYVVCNRICQQMQIADLVVVDLSSQNPNVFYELGMAIAFGKLILPICYSESYYKMMLPEQLEALMQEYNSSIKNDENIDFQNLKHHIDCYPWRRDLFEFYGILFKRKFKDGETEEERTRYLEHDRVVDSKYGFSDVKYSRFPYHEKINDAKEIIGKQIYEMLAKQYNQSKYADNTLVVYTMEAFLNEEQAGRCIMNFYRNITARMKQEECFCGERVGVLVQSNVIPENDKDSKKELHLNYNIGEIIHLGVNQATYSAEEERIKTKDVLNYKVNRRSEEKDNIIRNIKGYNRNKGVLVYPDNPIYVERLKLKLQTELLKQSGEPDDGTMPYNLATLALFHVMLRTLRYTNQIVVDISNNSLQSLFWLGAAHGKGINAITVLHEDTEKERVILTGVTEKKIRNVFDVAGLWTAVFQSNDTEGFYKQLAGVYEGMERHSKLMISDPELYKKTMYAFMTRTYLTTQKTPYAVISDRKRAEKKKIESYYRSCILNQMLCYNKLNIYIEEADMMDTRNQPKGYMSKWDFQAVSALSNYLSKRSLIGEYHIIGMEKSEQTGIHKSNEREQNVNYICIGQEASSGGKKIIEEANAELDGRKFHEKWVEEVKNGRLKINYSGFKECGTGDIQGIIAQLTNSSCDIFETCHREKNCQNAKFKYSAKNLPTECLICQDSHVQIGQLVLWRTASVDDGRVYFRIGLNGCSGPATYALATLLINDAQKEQCLEVAPKEHFLYSLQTIVRIKFLKEYEERLTEKLWSEVFKCSDEEDEQHRGYKEYMELIVFASCNYLSTILYQFFLPFLTDDDIKSIHNSLQFFVNNMKATRKAPLGLVLQRFVDKDNLSKVEEEIVRIVPEVLLVVLKRFRGVEAFYKVEVEHKCEATKAIDENDKKNIVDNRRVKKITELRGNVNCLFVSEDKI